MQVKHSLTIADIFAIWDFISLMMYLVFGVMLIFDLVLIDVGCKMFGCGGSNTFLRTSVQPIIYVYNNNQPIPL